MRVTLSPCFYTGRAHDLLDVGDFVTMLYTGRAHDLLDVGDFVTMLYTGRAHDLLDVGDCHHAFTQAEHMICLMWVTLSPCFYSG